MRDEQSKNLIQIDTSMKKGGHGDEVLADRVTYSGLFKFGNGGNGAGGNC